MCKNYNGYSNYQTWNVSLWLDNNEDTYHHVRRMADIFKLGDTSWEFVDWLKNHVENTNPLADNASVYSDLLGHALASVNWNEIADNILEE